MAANTSGMADLEGEFSAMSLQEERQRASNVVAVLESEIKALQGEVEGLKGDVAAREGFAQVVWDKNVELQTHLREVQNENVALRERLQDFEQLHTFQRKPVCEPCWLSKDDCDLDAQCQSCLATGARCVRKICHGWDRCTREGCPRVHRGEFEHRYQGWELEEGRLAHMDHRQPPRDSGNQETGYRQ